MAQPYQWMQIEEHRNPWEKRPSDKELGDELIADAEFQALRLGG